MTKWSRVVIILNNILLGKVLYRSLTPTFKQRQSSRLSFFQFGSNVCFSCACCYHLNVPTGKSITSSFHVVRATDRNKNSVLMTDSIFIIHSFIFIERAKIVQSKKNNQKTDSAKRQLLCSRYLMLHQGHWFT